MTRILDGYQTIGTRRSWLVSSLVFRLGQGAGILTGTSGVVIEAQPDTRLPAFRLVSPPLNY